MMVKKHRRQGAGRVRTKSLVENVTLAQYNGDHGPNTQAATAGTVIVAIPDSPNKMARRQRINVINAMDLTMRQLQAAQAIETAHCKTEMLSSGGPLKEYVQASPKPDAAVAMQCDAISRMVLVMSAVRKSEREIVEHVCFHNQPLRTLNRPRATQIFRECMDRVADKLHY